MTRRLEVPMKQIRTMLLFGALLAPAALAQQTGIQRADVGRHDLEIPGRELIQVRVAFAPGAAFGRHSHPGAEVAYVLAGTLQYQFDGEQPRTLQAGEALFIPAGTVHSAKNVGKVEATELATYVVEKGKPILVLAPD